MVTRNHENGREEINNYHLKPHPARPVIPKRVFSGALDLLLDAIQFSAFGQEEEESGNSDNARYRKTVRKRRRDGHFRITDIKTHREEYFSDTHDRKRIRNTHDPQYNVTRQREYNRNPQLCTDEDCGKALFAHKGVPISQKKVARRAKNVYKSRTYVSAHIMLPAKELGSLVADGGSRRTKESTGRKMPHALHEEEESKATESEDLKGDFRVGAGGMGPIARTKHGRSQILPSRYNDSVLQPWKRGTRPKKLAQ